MPQAELRYAVVVDDEDEAAVAVALGAKLLKIKASSPDGTRSRAPHRTLRTQCAPAHRREPRLASRRRPHAARSARRPADRYVEEPCLDAHLLLAEPLLVRIALDESLIELSAR